MTSDTLWLGYCSFSVLTVSACLIVTPVVSGGTEAHGSFQKRVLTSESLQCSKFYNNNSENESSIYLYKSTISDNISKLYVIQNFNLCKGPKCIHEFFTKKKNECINHFSSLMTIGQLDNIFVDLFKKGDAPQKCDLIIENFCLFRNKIKK